MRVSAVCGPLSQPCKYYGLGDGYCSYDFFAKCPHRLAFANAPSYLPEQPNAGQLLAVKDGIDRMLEQSTSPTTNAPHSKATERP
jgi:hypothetical protein